MLSLIETRNRHFMRACRRILSEWPSSRPISLAEVATEASLSPAPHYYCTYEYALRMLRVLRHGRLILRRDRRLSMWQELNGRVTRHMERRGTRLPQALAHVLAEGGASQFFISPATAHRLVQRLRHESFKNKVS